MFIIIINLKLWFHTKYRNYIVFYTIELQNYRKLTEQFSFCIQNIAKLSQPTKNICFFDYATIAKLPTVHIFCTLYDSIAKLS